MKLKTKGNRRPVKAVVISDVHLGTYASKAVQLGTYLNSIQPEILVLNGDIVDAWQFSRNYFPVAHVKLLRQFLKMMETGTQIYYVAGNHDEMMRRFAGLSMGGFKVVNKVVLELDGHKTWIFHGDVFDGYMHRVKWLAKLGAKGYGIISMLNKTFDLGIRVFGKKRVSISKKVKTRMRNSKKEVTRFEKTVADLAISKGYRYAICGHVHKPDVKLISTEKGSVTYLNSGDWVENMTSLEYNGSKWHLKYWNPVVDQIRDESPVEEYFDKPSKALFLRVFREVVGS
jgi:UDP-2,3-diacylglucosamine pyrophosphatase LpxH